MAAVRFNEQAARVSRSQSRDKVPADFLRLANPSERKPKLPEISAAISRARALTSTNWMLQVRFEQIMSRLRVRLVQ